MRRSNWIADYERWCGEGFGQGRGRDYRPWFHLRDAPTCSCKRSFYSLKLDRWVVLFSHGEVLASFLYDWLDNVVDMREQFPLDPRETQRIALELGVPHPGYHQGGTVMTTDFVITFRSPGGALYERAVQIKYAQTDLDKKRTAEKLCIEQQYWEQKGIPWCVTLSSEFDPLFFGNLEALFPFRNRPLPPVLKSAAKAFYNALPNDVPVLRLHNQPDIAGMPYGEAVRRLLGRKVWLAPIRQKRLTELCKSDIELNEGMLNAA